MSRFLVVCLLLLLLAALLLSEACVGAGTATITGPTSPAGTDQAGRVGATLVRVVDGDTILVRMRGGKEERVRYVGIDAPESVEPDAPVEELGPAAAAHNQKLLGSGPLLLAFDVTARDQHGRLLAYVWAGEVFVNEAMVRDGFAEARHYPPNLRLQSLLDKAEKAAREAGLGLWTNGPTG